MSGYMDRSHRQGEDSRNLSGQWKALSGDNEEVAAQKVVHGAWSNPWRDDAGQWHYPYEAQQPQEAPPYVDATARLSEEQPKDATPEGSVIVTEQELDTVAVPRYYAPQQAVLDPRQRTMAAVITFVALIFGLWGILGFTGSLAKTLSSVSSGNQKLKVQLTQANKGLADLDRKTYPLIQMSSDSEHMAKSLGGIEKDMGTMLSGVDEIASGMTQMGAYLDTLESELGQVNSINQGMARDLGGINSGLKSQLSKVRTMRQDVQATGGVLGQLQPRLRATNARLRHVNGAVNTMGCLGITNQLNVKIKVGPLTTGSAKVSATVVPPGAWGMRADGVTPC